MKKWIRFECGDVICAPVKKLKGGDEYRVTTDSGWMFVSWRSVFDTERQAKENKPRSRLGDYVQVFRKPVVFKPWYIDAPNKPTKEFQPLVTARADLCEFLSILEPQKSPCAP